MKLSRSTIKLARKVWDDRNAGRHAWKPYYNGYITIEPMNDGETDYLQICRVSRVDDLGYPYGELLDMAEITSADLEDLEKGILHDV